MGIKDFTKANLTRRTFLQGMAAAGAVATVTGCSSDDGELVFSGSGGNLPGSIAPEDLSDLSKAHTVYTTCPHNCGPGIRCVSKPWIVNGRVVRVTSDDSEYDTAGNLRDKHAWNDAKHLACAKGRSYKYRLYHTGRIRYPMKQTKERGDVTGFVRITWQQAYNEVMRKHRAIYAKYGPAAIMRAANNGTTGDNASASVTIQPIVNFGGVSGTFSDHSFHQFNYCRSMAGIPGNVNYSASGIGSQIPGIATGAIKHWVSFGTNSMSTNNTLSYPYLRANQKARALNPGYKHYVIAPELSDTGVLNATDWVQIRNQTDPALIAGMIYEMIVNTFNEDGSIKSDAWLDVDYIDTVLYGFFDSPAYWIVKESPATYLAGTDVAITDVAQVPATALTVGAMTVNADGSVASPADESDWTAEPGFWYWNTATPAAVTSGETDFDETIHSSTTTRWRSVTNDTLYAYSIPFENVDLVNAVPTGKSYASWIMGDDDRLTKAMYSASQNYVAQSYGNVARAGACTMPVKGVAANAADISTTAYYTKKDYTVAKTPEWAEKITGTPASVIRELARFFTDENNHPFMIEWTGGLQKSENGVLTLFAIQTLKALTKHWGYSHGSTGTIYQTWASNPGNFGAAPAVEELPNPPTLASVSVTSTGSGNPSIPRISCKEHFNGLYMAFKDVLDAKGFKGGANPFWDGSTRYLSDDAGAKTLVLYKRATNGTDFIRYTDTEDGREYYDYVGRETNSPVFVGKRMYIGCSGTQFNQVANTNWAAEIFKLLPLAQDNPDDPDTFCFVVAEPYMSPQARYADYVFPLASPLEAVDVTPIGTINIRRLGLIDPPAEAKSSWDAAFIGWNEASKLGAFSASRIDGGTDYARSVPNDAGYVAIGSTAPNYVSIEDKYRQMIQEKCNDDASRFAGMTVEEAIASQGIAKTAVAEPSAPTITKTDMRTGLEAYLNDANAKLNTPFVIFEENREFSPQVRNNMDTYTAESAAGIPASHGRMTCYAEYAVYRWEKAYDIYHGWLPADQRGQINKDYENDPKLYPIPMYYAFEDAFNEMYGVFNTDPDRRNPKDNWKLVGSKPATNDVSLIKDRLTLTVGSTHDRFRSHSSQAENPYLRELNHRTKGGKWASGNDWNEYAVVPTNHTIGGEADFNPMLSSAIQQKKLETASWHEFWMNDEDAKQFGIVDGDLVRVSNPVGAIRVVARVTKRIVRGHGQIHQGAWYDPNPVDGVDDGACANTIMSNRPSKFDNGNSVHCAYCVVEKENSF